MGFVETKMINSDFLNEPINHLNYMESIERFGDKSFLFKDNHSSKRILKDLISSSMILFENDSIRSTLIKNLKSDDYYYLLKDNNNLGQCLNLLLGVTCFSTGDFNDVCEYMNMTSIRSMNSNLLSAFSKLMKEHLESDDAITWIKERFSIDLSSYDTLEKAILNSDGWKSMIKSGSFMSCACTTEWFTDKVVEARHVRIWRTTNSDYYTDDGKHYTSEGTADGKDIAVDALKLLQTQGIVTEEYLTVVDSAYQRLEDSLLWFAQNNAISSLKGYPELIDVFVNNEACINYLISYPDILKEALNDETFARALLGNSSVKTKLTSDSNANAKITEFNANLTTVDTNLKSLVSSCTAFTGKSSSLYHSSDVMTKVNAMITKINAVDKIINEVKSL